MDSNEGNRIFYRKDLGDEFHIPTVGKMREMLNRCELPDDYELLPNRWGNFAIYHETDPDHPRDYIGYIDLHTGQVHCDPKAIPRRYDPETGEIQQNTAPGFDDQRIFDETLDVTYIYGVEDQSLTIDGVEFGDMQAR